VLLVYKSKIKAQVAQPDQRVIREKKGQLAQSRYKTWEIQGQPVPMDSEERQAMPV
jgi:hypothetical protein